jgi:hypothetical protein
MRLRDLASDARVHPKHRVACFGEGREAEISLLPGQTGVVGRSRPTALSVCRSISLRPRFPALVFRYIPRLCASSPHA